MDSLAGGQIEESRHTAKYMAIALAAVVLLGRTIALMLPEPLRSLCLLFWALSAAGYWVLTAWWVYLDAMWRRMNAVPWAILTLLTNVFGLVTYLVIRYPDPRSCHNCGAYLTVGLKRCPYCGSESEPTCPRCQAPVKSDWLYCPACAAQIPPTAQSTPPTSEDLPVQEPSLNIRGSVADSSTGAAIPAAQVKIDSKREEVSATTDQQGRFEMIGLKVRPYVIVASAPGYAPEARSFTPNSGTVPMVNFSLQPVNEVISG